MKKLTLALLCTLPMNASAACFYSHERTSGMNKICYYDCVDGQRAITISAVELCPLSLYRAMRAMMGLGC